MAILKSNLENSKVVSYTFAADVDTSNFVEKGYSAILLAPKAGGNPNGKFQAGYGAEHEPLCQRADRARHQPLYGSEPDFSQELKIDPKRIDSLKATRRCYFG
jgi:ABC-2 type transport system permease protein